MQMSAFETISKRLRRFRRLIAIGDCLFEALMDAWHQGRVATPARETGHPPQPANSTPVEDPVVSSCFLLTGQSGTPPFDAAF